MSTSTGKQLKPKLKPNLKLRHQKFAERVMTHGNGTQAAAEAGFHGDRDTLAVTASRLLRSAKVQNYLRERLEGLKATTDEVLNLLSDHLRGDIADLWECFDDDGSLDLQMAKERGVSRLVRKFRTHQFTDKAGVMHSITTIEMYSSQRAAEKLADILGLKQQPRESEADTKERHKIALGHLAEVMTNLDLDEASARQWMADNTPKMARYL